MHYPPKRYNESGSVLTALFIGIAMLGFLSFATYNLISGPVRTASVVTMKTKAQNEIILAAKLLMRNADDTDADTVNEAPPFDPATTPKPTGGGGIPSTIGASKVDPWHIPYGYCVWDHGTVNTSANRLSGSATAFNSKIVLAVISAGPNRIFNTTCGADPTYLTQAPGSDDIVEAYTFDQAQSLELWKKRTDSGNENKIEYAGASVLVGNIVTPGNEALQVGGDGMINGSLTATTLTVTGSGSVLGGLNATPIGQSSPAAAAFSSLVTSGVVSLTGSGGMSAINAIPIGTTTPAAGSFTTLATTSTALVTNLNSDYLNGQHGSFYQNASNLNAGRFDPLRLPAVTGDLGLTRTSATAMNATVIGLQGTGISSNVPNANEALIFDGTTWTPGSLSLGGDVTGTLQANTVTRLQGRTMSGAAPAANSVLGWNGTQWAPMAIGSGSGGTIGGGSQWTTAGSNIYYNTGNVGIGTATPTYTLDVAGNTRSTGTLTLESATTAWSAFNGALTATQSGGDRYLNFISGAILYDPTYSFYIKPSSTTGGINLINNGHDVYIGDVDGKALQVLSDANNGTTVFIKRGLSVGHLPLFLDIAGNDAYAGYNYGTKSGSIRIYPGNESFGNGIGTVVLGHDGSAARGDILVGTSTDSGYKFDVSGTFRTSGVNTLSNLAGTGSRPVVADANGVLSTAAGGSGGSAAGSDCNVQYNDSGFLAGSTNFCWDKTNFRLGIGTVTPAYPLDVSGGSALTTLRATHTGNDGGVTVSNTGTLALNRTSQVRLSNGTTLFGTDDRSYQLINIGESTTGAAFQIQYWNGTSYNPRMRIASDGSVTLSNLAGTGQRMVVVDAAGKLIASSTGNNGITGNIALNQVAFGVAQDQIGGSNNFLWNGATLGITGALTTSGTISTASTLSAVNPHQTTAGAKILTDEGGVIKYRTLSEVFADAAAQGGLASPAAGSTGYVQFNTGGSLDAESNFFWDKTNHRLGIGTVAPQTLMHIMSGAAASGSGQEVLRLSAAVVGATVGSGPKIIFTHTDNTPVASVNAYTFGAGNVGLSFGTGYSANTNKVFIDQSGSVGIGTSSMDGKLKVENTDTGSVTAVFVKNNATNATTNEARVSLGPHTGYTVNVAPYIRAVNEGNDAGLGFGTYYGGLSEKVTIKANGNVGIGTTAPGAKLEINTGADATKGLVVKGNSATQSGNLAEFVASNGNAAVYIQGRGPNGDSGLITAVNQVPGDPSASSISSGASFGLNGSPVNFYGIGLGAARNSKYDIWYQTGNANGGGYRWYISTSEKMTMDYQGNVGIGTTAPGKTLDVSGTFRTSGVNTLSNLAGTGSRTVVADANGVLSAAAGGSGASTPAAGSDGQVQFNDAGFLGANSNFFWDKTNFRLGLGTVAPQTLLDVGVGSVTWSNWNNSNTTSVGSIITNNLTGPAAQKLNARASMFAAVAARNPGSPLSIFIVPWDGSTTLENNCQTQINSGWHAQGAVKGNYFNQAFDNTDSTQYSSMVLSEADFNSYKANGTQWWIGCSIGSAFSQTGATANGTVNYVSKFTSANALSNSQIFDNGSNVGIGTTTPQGKFNVDGGLFRVSAQSVTNNPYVDIALDTSGTPYSYISTGDNVSYRSLVLAPFGGNVGIGTTSPGKTLDVSGTFRTSGVNTLSNLAGTGSRTVVADANGVLSAAAGGSGAATPAAGSDGQVQFNDAGFLGANSNFFWDKTNFRLGLGTVVPSNQLTITNTVGSINPVQVNIAGNGGIQLSRTGASPGNASMIVTTNGALQLSSDENTVITAGGAQRLTVVGGNGNVGIGTTSPGYKLDVQGATSSLLRITNTAGASTDSGATIAFLDANNFTSSMGLSTSGTQGNFILRTHAGTYPFIINSGAVTMANLAGTGSRTVVADVNGVLSATTAAGTIALPLDADTAPASKRIIGINAAADPFLGYRGTRNVYLGTQAGAGLDAATGGADNTFMGYQAGKATTFGAGSVYIGSTAGAAVTTNGYNTFVGYQAGPVTTTSNNVFIGYQAGKSNLNGGPNTFIGRSAGFNNTSGNFNTYIGDRAGYANTTADGNTTLGYYAGSTLTTGTNNVFIGRDTGGNGSQKLDADNSIAIGYGTYTTADNQTVIGNTFATSAIIRGAVTLPAMASGGTAPTTSGTTKMVTTDANGLLSFATIPSSGGNPGGTDGQVQYNDAGAFGGNSNFFWDKTNFRLGIGTVTPTYRLDVTGTGSQIRIGASAVDSGGTLLSVGASNMNMAGGTSYNGSNWVAKSTGASIINEDSGTIGFFTNSGLTVSSTYSPTQRMIIDTNGNVGIGTTSPTIAKLVISAAGGSSGAGPYMINTDNTTTSGLFISNAMFQASNMTAGQVVTSFIGKAPGTNNLGYMGYKHAGDNSTSNALTWGFWANDQLMTLLASGNVGIGTTSPMGLLDVNGGVGGLVVTATNLDPASSYSFTSLQNTGKLLLGWNRSAGGGEADFITNRAGGSEGGFNFYDYTNSGSLNYLASIAGNGNVRINSLASGGTAPTTSGTTKMVVSDANGLLSFATIPGGGGGGTPGGTDGQVQYNDAGAFGGNANFFWDKTNFRLGLGTVTPHSTLEIASNAVDDTSYYIPNIWSTYAARINGNLSLFSTGAASTAGDSNQLNFYGRYNNLGQGYQTNKSGYVKGRTVNGASIGGQPSGQGMLILGATTTTYNGTPTYADNDIMTLTNGNVGIGTTAPAYKLDIAGANGVVARFGMNGSTNSRISVGYGGGTHGLEIGSFSGYAGIENVASGLPIILQATSGGNVGIGTTAPGTKLEVNGSITATSSTHTYVNSTTTGTNTNAAVGLTGLSNASWLIGTNRGDLGWSADDLFFYKGAGTTGAKMIIKDNGNVGINMMSPGYPLDVQGVINSQVTGTGSTSNTTYANFTAYNPGNTYPRASFLIGQNASDANVGLVVAPLFSSAGVQKLAALNVSTNKDGNDSGQYVAVVSQSTSIMNIANYKQNGGVTGGTDITFSPGGNEALRTALNGNVTVQTLKTGATAPTTSGTTKMVVTDANGLLSFATIPGGGLPLDADTAPASKRIISINAGADPFLGYIGGSNVYLGNQAGKALDAGGGGSDNSFFGYKAGFSNTSGCRNVFMGFQSGGSNTTTCDSTFIGYNSGYSNAGGTANTFIGRSAGFNNTSGTQNVFIGYVAGAQSNGSSDVFIGDSAGYSNTSGSQNVFIGQNSGNANVSGGSNTFLGYISGQANTGSNNVFLGHGAGGNVTTGSNNILIGQGAWGAYDTVNNFLNIGNSTNGQVFYGDMASGNMVLKGTLTAPSDRRLKHDIQPVTGALARVEKLQGVTYHWKKEYKPDDRAYLGFIAQDIQKVVPEVVYHGVHILGSSETYFSVSYEQLTPLLVEAIKEQQNIITEARKKTIGQQAQIEDLTVRLSRLEKMMDKKDAASAPANSDTAANAPNGAQDNAHSSVKTGFFAWLDRIKSFFLGLFA